MNEQPIQTIVIELVDGRTLSVAANWAYVNEDSGLIEVVRLYEGSEKRAVAVIHPDHVIALYGREVTEVSESDDDDSD